MEPVEITTLQTLQEPIAQSGVITTTRGPFNRPTAHMADCSALCIDLATPQ
jgi:hypothetical protein